jgi:hypothetical protein
VIIVVAVVGGIIWYNLRKSAEFMVAAAKRRMVETDAMISDRIRLLCDPLYAIVDIASQVPEMKAPINDKAHVNADAAAMLRFYPQIFSLFVGFENGDFSRWLTSPANSARASAVSSERRRTPPSQPRSSHAAATVYGLNAGYFSTTTVSRLESATPHRRPSTRGRVPGMGPALHSDHVELSDLFVFVSNNEPGFHLEPRLPRCHARCLWREPRSDGLIGFSGQTAHHPEQSLLHIYASRQDRGVSGRGPNGGDRAAGR